MILVTGVTGTVGREVMRRLPADVDVRVMARVPARVSGAGPAVEVVAADYRDPRSLTRALAGVRAAFLVTTDVGGHDDVRFLRAASMAGVQRLVKLSAAAVLDDRADDLITRWQRTSEDLLRACGLEWTLLRPRAFMSNSLSWGASVRSEGVVRGLNGTSANACVDPRDVAEVAVRALTGEGHGGHAYTLTGPESITPVEQAHEISRLLGVPIRFEELSREEARIGLLRRHPEPVVEALLASAERQGAGAKVQVEDTVRKLIGRPAGTFREWVGDHLKTFKPVAEVAGTAT